MDPECTSDPNGMAAPDDIHPIFAQSIEFLKALIEKDKSGEGTMSRPTKLAIENSIKGFKDSEFTVRSRSMYRDLWQQIRMHSVSSLTCLGRRSRVDWKQSGTNQALRDI